MKQYKLTNKGFSAVEILIAAVVVVAVVGLGVFAFNNRSKNSSESNKSAETSDEVALINNDSEAEAVQASAGGKTIVGNAISGKRKVGALVCTTGPNRLKVVFVKTGDKDVYTDVLPHLILSSGAQRTGQIEGGHKWWLGSLQLYEKGVGNHKANDTVKVKYNGKLGPATKWGSIRQC